MRGHGRHLAICAGLMLVGGLAAAIGLGALEVLAGAGCMAMMGLMVWTMIRATRS